MPAKLALAVLLISADLDELIGLSDSIKVLLRGKFVADADPATVTPQELGTAMTGAGRGCLMNLRRLATSLIAPAIGLFVSLAATALILICYWRQCHSYFLFNVELRNFTSRNDFDA